MRPFRSFPQPYWQRSSRWQLEQSPTSSSERTDRRNGSASSGRTSPRGTSPEDSANSSASRRRSHEATLAGHKPDGARTTRSVRGNRSSRSRARTCTENATECVAPLHTPRVWVGRPHHRHLATRPPAIDRARNTSHPSHLTQRGGVFYPVRFPKQQDSTQKQYTSSQVPNKAIVCVTGIYRGLFLSSKTSFAIFTSLHGIFFPPATRIHSSLPFPIIRTVSPGVAI